MIERQDRRAAGVNRVNVARLVDICGRDASVPAFEAESIELSGRGMHVRTPYLPPLGAPLVCRLEHGGREIVVEGVVAWQQHNDGGGEFGIQFTALDSGSVEALKIDVRHRRCRSPGGPRPSPRSPSVASLADRASREAPHRRPRRADEGARPQRRLAEAPGRVEPRISQGRPRSPGRRRRARRAPRRPDRRGLDRHRPADPGSAARRRAPLRRRGHDARAERDRRRRRRRGRSPARGEGRRRDRHRGAGEHRRRRLRRR